MKTLITYLFFTCFLWGQEVSFRVDWSNVLWGSDVNPPALNWKIGMSDYYNGTYTKLGFEVERFAAIDYWQWTFMKIDQEFSITEYFSFLTGVAFSQIYHRTSYSNNALSYAFNLEIQYRLNDWLKLSIQANRERATDIEQLWRDSAYGGIIYYWKY